MRNSNTIANSVAGGKYNGNTYCHSDRYSDCYGYIYSDPDNYSEIYPDATVSAHSEESAYSATSAVAGEPA